MKHHVRMALAPPRVPFLFIVAGARRRRTNHRHAQAASLRARKPRVAVGYVRDRTHAHARTPPRAQSWGRRRLWARIALFPGLLSTRARARARAELAARRVLRVLGGGAAPVRAGGDGHHGVHRGRPHRGRCKSNKQVTGNCNDKLDVLVMEYIEVACIETCQLQLQCQRRQQQFDNDNDSGDRNGLLGKAWAAVAGHTGAASLLQWCPCRSGGGV